MMPNVTWLDDPDQHLYMPDCGTEHGPCWSCGKAEDEHRGRFEDAETKRREYIDGRRKMGLE